MFSIVFVWLFLIRFSFGVDESGVVMPSRCETCKFVVTEIEARLKETESHDVLRTAKGVEMKYCRNLKKYKYSKKFSLFCTNFSILSSFFFESEMFIFEFLQYRDSEVRLIETMDDLCERILKYNMHKEHKDSNRFAKGRSQTMDTLHDLVEKGVKVELGIPYDLWDSPSAEITEMKRQCEYLLENYEDSIERWYHKFRGEVPLKTYLCEQRALKNEDKSCLYEKPKSKDKKSKGDRGEL